MALNCPNKSHPLYQAVLEKLNGDEMALYRLWSYHTQANPGVEFEKILDRFDTGKFSNSMKQHLLNTRIADLDRDDADGKHKYFFRSRPDVEINSMSRELDSIDEIAYHGTTEKEGYADAGTDIHEAFPIVAGTTAKSEGSLRQKLTEEYGLPESAYDQFRKLEKLLTKDGGVLVFEQKLLTGEIEGKSPVAGASDIIRFNQDGSYEVFDLKTSNLTKRISNGGGKIWEPTLFKRQRYSTQLMGYGRMVEQVLLQPPKNYYIIPIEVETLNDEPGGKIVEFKILPPENIETYGMKKFASNQLDKIFRQTSFMVTTEGSDRYKDTSSSIYASLTGDVSGGHIDANALATNIWKRRTQRNVGLGRVWGYITSDNEFVPFTNQSDYKSQISQIESDYVNQRKKYNTDLSYSVINYLTTGNTEDITQIGKGSDRVINLLQNFVGKPNIEVTALNTIPGFSDKLNWILIKEHLSDNTSATHVLYIGNDNLKSTFTTSFGNDSVFGKFLDETTSRNITKTNLKNTIGDAHTLEGTMIAMKLKADNPSMRFGIMSVFGTGGAGYAQQIDLKENLNTLQKAIQEPVLRKELFTSDFIQLASDENIFDYKGYQNNWLDSLMHNVDAYWNSRGLDKINLVEYYKDYKTNALSHKSLVEELKRQLLRKADMGVNSATDYNTYLLSMAYLQLMNIDFSLTPEGALNASVGVPFLVKNPMLQDVNLMLQNYQTGMIQEFWKEYKDPYIKKLSSFFKSKGFANNASDRLLGDTPRYYTKLFKTATVKVQTESGIVEKTIPMFEFHEEKSPEYNALSKEDQDLITTSNDMIQKMAKKAGLEWRRGQLPLVRASVANKFFNAMRLGGVAQYTQLVNNYLIDLEASYGQGEDKEETLDNIFFSQSRDEIARAEMMGFQKDGFLNYDSYSQWSTNLEQMMDIFTIQSLKGKYMNDVSATIRATKSAFNWYKSNLLDDRLDYNIDFLNWFHTVNIIGRDIDSGNDLKGKANRQIRVLNRTAGLYYIALDTATAAASLVGNELTMMSQSLANKLSGISGIKPENYFKSKGIITKALTTKAFNNGDYEKIHQLMFYFRMYNQDMTQLLSGYHREGDKSVFNTKWLYGLMNAADWESRASLMISTMLEEGSWSAYSVDENGILQYDETKDSRLNGQGKYKNEEAAALRKMLADAQGLNPGEKLTFGHDENMGTSIRTTANYLFGGYDKETKSMMNFKWWGKLFISQKNWLPAKLQRWTSGRLESKLMGEYQFDRSPTGELTPVWKGDQMEGILVSMLTLIKNVQRTAKGLEKDPWKSLSKIQKQNILRGVSDIIIAGLAMIAYMAIPDDDDDTVYDDASAEIIKRGIDDLLVIYNVFSADDFLWTPIPLKMTNTILTKFFNNVSGEITVESVMSMVPIASSVQQNLDMITIDEDENQ